jgi:predicted RNA binding protein YcfA (HicA-like mRNA interferase family)
MCRILEQHGWTLVRIKGSHHAFQKVGNAATIVVPVHGSKDLKSGTQHAIIKDAGLKDDDL